MRRSVLLPLLLAVAALAAAGACGRSGAEPTPAPGPSLLGGVVIARVVEVRQGDEWLPLVRATPGAGPVETRFHLKIHDHTASPMFTDAIVAEGCYEVTAVGDPWPSALPECAPTP